jgi:hypothetical protein
MEAGVRQWWTVEAVEAICDDRELAGVMRWAAAQHSHAQAMAAAAVRRAEETGAVGLRGHASTKGWIRAVTGWGPATCCRLLRMSRSLTRLPRLHRALADGLVHVDNADVFAALHRNPRVRAAVEECEEMLLGMAIGLPHADFVRAAERFRAHADPDGAELSHEQAHEQRSSHVTRDGVVFQFSARGGTAAGAEITAVLQRFAAAEFAKDAAFAGPGGALPRTAPQRDFDAFLEMCRAAARSGRVELPAALVNYVIDEATYRATLARLCGDDVDPPDPAAFQSYLSETTDGVPIDPRIVVHESVIGRLRRVVIAEGGVVVSMGRRQRLFKGPARDAVLLRFRHCAWPGCRVPASLCQADHLRPWDALGRSDNGNGIALCSRHNRLKGSGWWDDT